jgi:C4-dicarboxylate-specific signal transduction histidine kinase
VGATVSAGLEPAETLSETLSLVASLLDLPAGAVWWIGAADQGLRLAASTGLPDALLDRLAAEVERRTAGQPTLPEPAGSPGTELQVHCEVDDADWTFRLLSLRGNREPIAWLAVGGPGSEGDESEDPGFLGAVAGQLGIAMENMQLYENLRTAYDQLRDAQAQAVRSEKLSALSRVISGVAHELNNPLAAVLGYCEVLTKDGVREEALPVVERMGRQAGRCARIVKELAAFVQPEEMSIAQVDIHEVLKSALEAAEHYRGEHTEIIEHLHDSLPATAGDARALGEALTNLIVNAYQAMEEGDGALTIETRTDNGEIVLVVSDT